MCPPTAANNEIASPMKRLKVFIEVGMPWVSSDGRRVLMALADQQGYPGPADTFAAAVGLRNRYRLGRVLQSDGLPCLEQLAGWIRVLTWVASWENSRMPLSRLALHSVKDPAPMFRLVERLTGHPWTQVRSLGFDWVFLRLLAQCQHSYATEEETIEAPRAVSMN
jgi:hypothetical protein